ncbi:MAG: hypothetical protein AAFY76_04920 [Cyanobacteria bacterium J06649_11]
MKNETIGTDLYRVFTEERITGDVSIWSKMSKRKLKRSITKQSQSNPKKTSWSSLRMSVPYSTRFLIAARKRPELELEETIGNYEFLVVPKSLF